MLIFWIQWHLFSCCDRTGDVDQLMEECRSLKDECQTLKNGNKQLSEKLEMLEQQRARWLATRPVSHTQTRWISQWASQTVSVNKAAVTDEAFSHNLSQWTLSLKLFSSYESVSQKHEALMTVYFILSKYTGSEMSHSFLTAILRHQDLMWLYETNASCFSNQC